MKRMFFVLSLLVITLAVAAVPAKRGVLKTLKLADGTEVKACLEGDEFGHFWRGADGKAYRKTSAGVYQQVDAQTVIHKARSNRQKMNAVRGKRLSRRAGTQSSYLGKKKGIIILVNFKNSTFQKDHDKALFLRIANEPGYNEGNFKGSMTDYFKDQSRGLFELDFDVLGPYTVSRNYSYYGANDEDGNDLRPGEMVTEAVNQANKEVADWSDYDWDNDGEVDQVYVVYAGHGEADYDDENVIWPHAYALDEASKYGDGKGPVSVNGGKKVNTYACGPELDWRAAISGIGTMCHEFSHCLGYPDYYDIDYSGGQGMGSWDLMDSGSYNDDGYQPAGYTSYERWVAGWMEPIVLESQDTTVENMKSLQNGGESYVIYNQKNRNEFFLLENRQLDSWDASLPGAGLLILHADYDEDVWDLNGPNDDPEHQRFTWIPADNKYQMDADDRLTFSGMANDPFPYGSSNAFNRSTRPAAKLYNRNIDNSFYLGSSVENIKQNDDETVSFDFVADFKATNTQTGDTIFYESFDMCKGKGGNDGAWSGAIASSAIQFDNDDWVTENAGGGDGCAKFGTSKKSGSATTPAFTVSGTAQLTFLSGAWNSENEGTTLKLSVNNGSIEPATIKLSKGGFEEYEAVVSADGEVKLTFSASIKNRFFLDDVLVTASKTTGISEQVAVRKSGAVYTLDGRYVGRDVQSLGRGLYIVDGKKIVK